MPLYLTPDVQAVPFFEPVILIDLAKFSFRATSAFHTIFLHSNFATPAVPSCRWFIPRRSEARGEDVPRWVGHRIPSPCESGKQPGLVPSKACGRVRYIHA